MIPPPMTLAEQSAHFDLVRAIQKAIDTHGEGAWRVVVKVLGERLGNAQRLIANAEAQTPGEQPPIVLLWEDYKAMVAERDAALALADDRERDLEPYEEEIDTLRQERDEARRIARMCYRFAKGGHASDGPKILLADLETAFPEWLTGKPPR